MYYTLKFENDTYIRFRSKFIAVYPALLWHYSHMGIKLPWGWGYREMHLGFLASLGVQSPEYQHQPEWATQTGSNLKVPKLAADRHLLLCRRL